MRWGFKNDKFTKKFTQKRAKMTKKELFLALAKPDINGVENKD